MGERSEKLILDKNTFLDIISLMTKTLNAMTDYLQAVKMSKSANTYITYEQALKKFASIVGDVPLSVEAYIKYLKATSNANPNTAALHSTAIIRMFRFHAARDSSINIAAIEQAKEDYLKRQGKRLPPFNREPIEKILEYCNVMRNDLIELRDRAFVLTLADTGARISEACHLRRGDIDWKEARAVIIGKGDKQAVLRFSIRALDALNDYLLFRQKLDGATGKPLLSLPLFARHDHPAGEEILPVDSGGMWYAVKALARRAGVNPESFRIHDFRHYFVTITYLAKGNLKLSQELARHETINTTNRYAHFGGEADQAYDEIFNR
jgi:integrase/recombinase XerC